MTTHIPAVIVGGGQAGLSVSYYLKHSGIDHAVLEKHTAMHTWSEARWDSFCLVTPNWQCQLPGHPYRGPEPHGFMRKHEILEYLAGFRRTVNAPLHESVAVQHAVRRPDGGFKVETSAGEWSCDHIVVACGGYHTPIIPRMAERLPSAIVQLHSEHYRNAGSLPAGAVLVVGSGQSGAQIAEDLHLAGRQVFLAVGEAPRCARFYRGRDVVDWLAQMQYYDLPVTSHPLREGVRDNTNHYVTGRDGGRDIDLRRFALEGMELFGRLTDVDSGRLLFKEDLTARLDEADRTYNGINAGIDAFIAKSHIDAPPPSVYAPAWRPTAERSSLQLEACGITSIVWCIGFEPNFRWLDAPVFNGRGQPCHDRGITSIPGLYFIGLPWLHTWGSGRFSGVARDAEYVAAHMRQLSEHRAISSASRNEVHRQSAISESE